jgi:hypothetical protein
MLPREGRLVPATDAPRGGLGPGSPGMPPVILTTVRCRATASLSRAGWLIVAAIGTALPAAAVLPGGNPVRQWPLPVAAPVWILPAPCPTALRRPFREVSALVVPHESQANCHGDENDHDNGCQSDHERSHRTIQRATTSRAAQSPARAAIDAGHPQLCLRPG